MPLLPADTWLATIYATSRKNVWATATTIYRTSTGMRVKKSSLSKARNSKIQFGALTLEHQVPSDEPFISGDLLLHRFQRLATEGRLTTLAEPVRQWIDLLVHGSIAASSALEDHLIPGDLVDCIPANLIVVDDSQLVMIDKEWVFLESVPLSWVVLRGLINTLHQCTFPYEFGRRRCEAVILDLLALIGYSIQPATFVEMAELEAAMQAVCSRRKTSIDYFRDALTASLPCLAPLERATEIDNLVARIAAYERSLSWRVTRPLRYAHRMLLARK